MVEKLEPGLCNDINGKMNFELVDPLYNGQWDQNAEISEYNVFTSRDVRDMAKMVGGVMKPAANSDVFCSSLQFSFWYKVLLSHFREDHTSIATDHEDSGSESKRREIFEN